MVFLSESTKLLPVKKVFVCFKLVCKLLMTLLFGPDEQNVLSIHGKLYAWDTDSANWTEKGRGFLRLNDVRKNDKLCSRLGECWVFRNSLSSSNAQ